MAFEVANRAFEEAFVLTEEKKEQSEDVIKAFLEMLEEYLTGHREWPARMIRVWIQHGGRLSAFPCREDAVQPMVDAFALARIPYVLVRQANGRAGFLIRESDVAGARNTIQKVLIDLSKNCTITTGQEAGMAYLKLKDDDRMMMLICGLNRGEAFFLKSLLPRAMDGETVGIDRMPDDTYTVTCHGKTAMKNRSGDSFCEALAEAMLMGSAGTAEMLDKRATAADLFLTMRAAGFPGKDGTQSTPAWVVGRGSCYVKRDRDGFGAGHAVVIGDEVHLEEDYRVEKEDAKYDERLNSALFRITDHLCLFTLDDVMAYFRKKKEQYRSSLETGQQLLAQNAAEIVGAKVRKDKIFRTERNWHHKARHYQFEVARLIAAAKDGKIPKGYEKADVLLLRKIMRTFELDARLLEPALEKIAKVEIYEREAGPVRLADIDELIRAGRGELAKERMREEEREAGIEMPGISASGKEDR